MPEPIGRYEREITRLPSMDPHGEYGAWEARQFDVCEHAGHEWVDAGGGVDICAVCEAMRDYPPRERTDRDA